MAIFIEVTEGPDLGSKYMISQGIRIGRSKGEILLKDTKVSSLHALVEKDPQGHLFLVDQNSTNGIKIKGKRVARLALLPGVRFQLGRNLLRVFEEEEATQYPIQTWNRVLGAFVTELSTENETQNAKAFSLPIKITAETGPLAGQSWLITWGPRLFGSENLDIELEDLRLPPLAFEIVPSNDGPVFKTPVPEQVRLNGRPVHAEKLHDGDVIVTGFADLRVSYVNT